MTLLIDMGMVTGHEFVLKISLFVYIEKQWLRWVQHKFFPPFSLFFRSFLELALKVECMMVDPSDKSL